MFGRCSTRTAAAAPAANAITGQGRRAGRLRSAARALRRSRRARRSGRRGRPRSRRPRRPRRRRARRRGTHRRRRHHLPAAPPAQEHRPPVPEHRRSAGEHAGEMRHHERRDERRHKALRRVQQHDRHAQPPAVDAPDVRPADVAAAVTPDVIVLDEPWEPVPPRHRAEYVARGDEERGFHPAATSGSGTSTPSR